MGRGSVSLWPLLELPLISESLDYLFPPPERRKPVTTETTKFYVVSFVLLVLMGGMARREGTWAVRLAVFPFAFVYMLKGTFGFLLPDPMDEGANHSFGTIGLLLVGKLIDYAQSPTPMLKLAEVLQPTSQRTLKSSGYSSSVPGSSLPQGIDGVHIPPALNARRARSFFRSTLAFIYDGLELFVNVRGVGWVFGTGLGLHVPSTTRNVHDRVVFVLQSLRSIASRYLMVDVCTTILHETPGVGTPQGGSIFAFGSNALQKYAISTVLHVLTGAHIALFMEMVYDFIAVVTVILGGDPAAWPPLVDKPWSSTSLHDFWGKRWHQAFRRPLLVVGGYPCAFIARMFGGDGRSMLVFGTFLASALLHNYDYYATSSGRTPGLPCISFFLAQPIGLALERLWRHKTGKNVDGWSGRLWVALWILVGAQPCVDSWHRLGFLGGQSMPPPENSPTRLFIIPLLRRFGLLVPI